LSLLRQVTQAEGASLDLDLQNQTRSWCDGSPNYVDPSSRQTLRFDRVYSQENLPALQEGGAPTRMIKVRTTNGAGLTLSISRSTHDRDFRSTDGQMLHSLAPFLGPAIGLWLDRQQERADAQIGETMLTALGGGWLVFDATGKILRLSANLTTDFQAAEGLPLKFGEPAISSAFAEAFAQAVAGEAPVAFSLSQGEMLLTHIEHDNAPAILGWLRAIPQCALISAQAVAHHFGVSTSEARLAILICDGHSLKAAAAVLGWTEETTRTCSKSLFARMGVSGQPDLVRRILNSSVWYKGSW
jgi:DNA-binding CsgD family transcriptional regulator